MQTIKLPDQDTPMNFTQARLTAVGKADEILKKPVIVAWKDDRTGKFAPEIPGGRGTVGMFMKKTTKEYWNCRSPMRFTSSLWKPRASTNPIRISHHLKTMEQNFCA